MKYIERLYSAYVLAFKDVCLYMCICRFLPISLLYFLRQNLSGHLVFAIVDRLDKKQAS